MKVSDPNSSGYPIRAVSKLTGISIDALRAWERRYQAVVPARTSRGRLYNASQVRRLTLLHAATSAGHSIGQVSKLDDLEIQILLAARNPVVSAPLDVAADRMVLRPVLAAIENYEYTAANTELGLLASLLPVPELVDRVVHPLLDLIGKRWHTGSISVAQEHMLSALLRNLLGGLVRLYHPRQPRVRILFATPAGELHEFGILCGAMLAVSSGIDAVYLGPNLPTPEIVAIANRLKPQALVLGVVAPSYIPDLDAAIPFIASQIPAATELWIGGEYLRPQDGNPVFDRIALLPNFPAMEPHLNRLVEAAD
jgi:MerR family transcriptional regulator, light-induced transcriptional regulator